MSEPVFFWNGPFSQWHRSPFVVDGSTYPTAEHFMMAGKAREFGDWATLVKIFETEDPRTAKALGRGVHGYDDETWRKVRFPLVCRGSYEKFRQNPELAEILIITGDHEIVEASPYDGVWGVGMGEREARSYYNEFVAQAPAGTVVQWPGLNLLGKALMAAREMLAQR